MCFCVARTICKLCNLKKKIDFSIIDCSKLFSSTKLLPTSDIILNVKIEELFFNVREINKLDFLNDVQAHYVASCKHLIKKSSLNTNECLKYLSFL